MEQKAQKIVTGQSGTDYTLLLKRIGQALVRDNENPKCREVLGKKATWNKLTPAMALEWAGLAQIAGMVDTALDIYTNLTAKDPEYEPAWQARIELLYILDRKEALASAVRQASGILDKAQVMSWIRQDITQASQSPVFDPEKAAEPFERMHTRQALVAHFMDLFFSRTDVFARQWADKQQGTSGYVPVRRMVTPQDLEDHFKGVKTYGFYLMDTDAMVRCAVIDADLVPDLRQCTGKVAEKARNDIRKDRAYMVSAITDAAQDMGLFPVIEFSGGKGYHFWFFMETPVKAARIRQALTAICDHLGPDLSCFTLEVFPKQDHLSGKGLGNLVKLPLGIHRQTGRRSFFTKCSQREIEAQLKFLRDVPRSDPGRIQCETKSAGGACVVLHPGMKELSDKFPDLFELGKKCPALGRLFALVRERHSIGVREEKIMFQTLGFLPRGKHMLHYLLSCDPEYNPHLVDYKLSRVRGTPLGCRRIHALTGYDRDFCRLEPDKTGYLHALIHLASWASISDGNPAKSERIENLSDAVMNMKTAIIQLERFLK
ncbi:CRISPR-associated primase-polymerase type A1 [Desulfobacter sp. UBA2225]|uniref:CRISPR-associated primase-polymerase type A1 n=1 Tax=Desulfobacter sp. UBA2225 TaxID=1961413 RepID=UPI00257A8807|nr:CRISPR-associated primase-polymerase type A1 [Desulfobacter sp. UBA2225]